MPTVESPEFTLSARSRNLGLGWSNHPVQQHNSRGDGYLVIETPAAPDVTGGLRAVETELSRARKLNSGNDYAVALFVAGQRVTAWWSVYSIDPDHESDPASWRQGWILPDLGAILHELREGYMVRVQTAGLP